MAIWKNRLSVYLFGEKLIEYKKEVSQVSHGGTINQIVTHRWNLWNLFSILFSKSALLHHRIPFMTFPEKRLHENKIRLRELTICEGEKLKKRWKFFFNNWGYKQFVFLSDITHLQTVLMFYSIFVIIHLFLFGFITKKKIFLWRKKTEVIQWINYYTIVSFSL